MRKARFTEHQIIAVIKSVEVGRTVKDVVSLKLPITSMDYPSLQRLTLSVQSAPGLSDIRFAATSVFA